MIKSVSTTEDRGADGTGYEADKASNLLIADKEEVDKRGIEAVQIKGSEIDPFSFDALDEGPLDQSNKMSELNFMIEPRVDCRRMSRMLMMKMLKTKQVMFWTSFHPMKMTKQFKVIQRNFCLHQNLKRHFLWRSLIRKL